MTEKYKSDIWLVEWQDAHSKGAWCAPKEVEEFIKTEKCICLEVGWILSETKDEIVMAARKLKWKEDGDMEYGLLQKIPRAWIRKKLLLRGK